MRKERQRAPRGEADEPLPGENQTGKRKLGSDENNTVD